MKIITLVVALVLIALLARAAVNTSSAVGDVITALICRVYVPDSPNACDVKIVSLDGQKFAVAVSKYGVGICQVK